MKNCIYRFLDDNDNIIYIGKAKNLKSRLNGHNHLSKKCYDETKRVEYISFKNENDMDFAERYFIHKENPKYNTALSDKHIDINVIGLDMLSWLKYNESNKDKNTSENKIKIITSKQREELELLRVKQNTIIDIYRESDIPDDLKEIISIRIDEASKNTKKMESSITKKLIANGIDKETAKIYVHHNIYDKEEIINKNLKKIEDKYLNECLEQIDKNGYYKQNIYILIDEHFIPTYTGIDYYWLSFLEGQWLTHMPKGCERFKLDNNVKDRLVQGIIKNIESKISQIYGEIKKDLIILKGNDHWANGLHGYNSMERDIPYIIYRVSK